MIILSGGASKISKTFFGRHLEAMVVMPRAAKGYLGTLVPASPSKTRGYGSTLKDPSGTCQSLYKGPENLLYWTGGYPGTRDSL